MQCRHNIRKTAQNSRILPNLNVLDAISKGMTTAKLAPTEFSSS